MRKEHQLRSLNYEQSLPVVSQYEYEMVIKCVIMTEQQEARASSGRRKKSEKLHVTESLPPTMLGEIHIQ